MERICHSRGDDMENMQLNLFTDDKNVLWKYDNELGIAYFCPNCKRFICGEEVCECGQELDYNKPKKYTGKVKF